MCVPAADTPRRSSGCYTVVPLGRVDTEWCCEGAGSVGLFQERGIVSEGGREELESDKVTTQS